MIGRRDGSTNLPLGTFALGLAEPSFDFCFSDFLRQPRCFAIVGTFQSEDLARICDWLLGRVCCFVKSKSSKHLQNAIVMALGAVQHI